MIIKAHKIIQLSIFDIMIEPPPKQAKAPIVRRAAVVATNSKWQAAFAAFVEDYKRGK